MSEHPGPWWDPFEVEQDRGLRWRLGPLTIDLHRMGSEWQVAHGDAAADAPEPEKCSVTPIVDPAEELPNLERYVADPSDTQVRLLPQVPDRSLVARPRVPLHILPGEEVRIFVSFPVWVRVEVGSSGRTMCELQVKRLSDTWFGLSSLVGEVAYALKTHARSRLTELPRPRHRALTPVVIRNRGADLLHIERMNLPVPHLSVFANDEGRLWTEQVTLERAVSDEMADLSIAKGAPAEARGAELLSTPRRVVAENAFVRAFSGLLNPFMGGDT